MRLAVPAAVAVVLLAPAAGPAQVTLGQVDTFENGTTQNWGQGFNSPPGAVLNVAGGPAGSTRHLQITATGGFGAGSRLTAFNRTQWLGNYTAAGVNAIEMDLLAPATNTQTLSIRLAFKSGTGGASPGYSSTAFALPADGQWRHAVFLLSADAWTPIGNPTASFDTLITNPAELRILHSAAPDLNGDTITAVVGVDNVRATFVPVPEPAGVLAAAAAVGAAGLIVRRKRKLGGT